MSVEQANLIEIWLIIFHKENDHDWTKIVETIFYLITEMTKIAVL